ncbi:MAG: hypothetical protein ACRED3_15095, partial [Bradyrhizobium sp.]
MGKALKWVGMVFFCLVLLALALYAISRLMPVPEDEVEALALLDAPDPLPGKNGFAVLWLLRYDVPLDQAEQLLNQEVARFAAGSITSDPTSYASVFDSLPRLDSALDDRSMDCRLNETGCLEKARSSQFGYEKGIESREKIASRVAELDAYDYFRNPFPPRFDMPLPAYDGPTRNLSLHAHAFVRGDAALALEGVCRDASIARKLVASGDNLIGSMIGVAMMKG